MLWSAEEMLDGQHQRVDISAHARTVHNGLLQKRLEEDLCWIICRVPTNDPLVKGLNWTTSESSGAVWNKYLYFAAFYFYLFYHMDEPCFQKNSSFKGVCLYVAENCLVESLFLPQNLTFFCSPYEERLTHRAIHLFAVKKWWPLVVIQLQTSLQQNIQRSVLFLVCFWGRGGARGLGFVNTVANTHTHTHTHMHTHTTDEHLGITTSMYFGRM